MRGVELADHLVDDVHQLVAVGDIGHQRLVLGAHRVPVGAVQLGIVEAIFHATPGVVEHLVPFLRLFDPDGDVEARSSFSRHRHARIVRRGSASRARPARTARAAAAGHCRHHPSAAATAATATDGGAVDRLTFLEEERAAVFGEPQVGDAPSEAAPHAARPIFVVADRRPGCAGGDPGHALAVILDGVDRRSRRLRRGRRIRPGRRRRPRPLRSRRKSAFLPSLPGT